MDGLKILRLGRLRFVVTEEHFRGILSRWRRCDFTVDLLYDEHLDSDSKQRAADWSLKI